MKNRYWMLILCAATILCGISGWLLLSPGQDARLAQVISDGTPVRTVDLRLDQEFTISAPGGGYNVISVQGGKIAVTEASCPDHYCMARGYCAGGAQIVCLPNKMVIKFLDEQEIDGVVG